MTNRKQPKRRGELGKSARRGALPDPVEKCRGKFGARFPEFFVANSIALKFWSGLISKTEEFESDAVSRLFEAVDDGLRLSGSKAQTASARRVLGGKISRRASELAALIRPVDVPGYIPGFGIDDPLQKVIHGPIQQMMDGFINSMIAGGWISPEPQGREKLMLRTGASWTVWHLQKSIELLAAAGEVWAATPPNQGHLRGDKALRRSVLFEVCKYMITFTGVRRPALESAAVNLLFKSNVGVEPLGARRREVDEALSKSQKKTLERAEYSKKQMELQRAEWLEDPGNLRLMNELFSGVKRTTGS